MIIKVLNKILRYAEEGLELEADPRHAEMVIRDLGLEGGKLSKIPGTKADVAKRRKEVEAVDAVDVQVSITPPKLTEGSETCRNKPVGNVNAPSSRA